MLYTNPNNRALAVSQFAEFEAKLNAIQNRIKDEGSSPELIADMEKLFENASVLVMFGPCDSVERPASEQTREVADSQDCDYYKNVINHAEFGDLFKTESLGEAKVIYVDISMDGQTAPGCRIFWQNRLQMVIESNTEDGKKTIEAHINGLAMMLGCRWTQWRFEVA